MKDRIITLSTKNIEKFNLINFQMHYDEENKNNEEVKSHTTTDLDVMHIQFSPPSIELVPHEHDKQSVSLL